MLREKGAEFEEIDLNRGLSVEELDKLIGKRDYRPFLNSLRKVEFRTNVLLDMGCERHRRIRAGRYIQAVDLAAEGHDDGSAVWCECIARQ